MVKFHNYETSRGIINALNTTQLKKEALIKKLNQMPYITHQMIKDYEASKFYPYNVEVDLFDNEFGYMTIALDVFCESEDIAKEKATIQIKENKVYCNMEIKDVFIVS